ncbi:ribulose-phosphate 3-epimerase [Fulvitalea axinellae]|uniref:Ribulose-phosphate 3-epimerase n=1 Tax=Fulvitalea axinellae TaxID=1182444 RepID=A0AAU9CIY0_9BACT|nr:ribulose-phosphate 3-epimerase [Fulvitalea axinellae]
MSTIIAPSILAADFAELKKEVEMVNRSEAEWLHVDIMDGMFVPNMSFGLPVCEAIDRYNKKVMDVHLMIEEPGRYVDEFAKRGAEYITVHVEACKHLHRDIQLIKSLGCKAGVALNPHSSVSLIEDVLPELDLVLVMSVNPGFGGQSLIAGTFDKIRRVKELIKKTGSKALIQVDGGVKNTNAAELVAAGADVLVAGSFVFSSDDPIKTIADLKADLA